MRIRSLLLVSTGAALGAGSMYLLDPEHGDERRREFRQEALRQARTGAVRASRDAKRRAGELTLAAVAGYREARAGDQHVA